MITRPKSLLIEQTAIELAAAFYDHARCEGLSCKPYKNQRDYVKKNFERFIPKALEHLTTLLEMCSSDIMKNEIYEALLERANYQPTLNGQVIPDKVFLN